MVSLASLSAIRSPSNLSKNCVHLVTKVTQPASSQMTMQYMQRLTRLICVMCAHFLLGIQSPMILSLSRNARR